ncbi:MAG: energy-coupling factor transporter transmembrane component T [bacterium]|nr:energy-coupling factor transporter transmembrane component T [bacterium]
MKSGQYIPGNSIIHSLDPRTKLLGTVFLLSLTLSTDNFIRLGIIIFVLSLMIILAQLQLRYVLGQLRPLIWFLIFTFLIYLLPVSAYSLNQRLCLGTLFTSKLIVLVLFVSILITTTPELDLVHGLEYLLSPLKKIRLPVQDLVLIIYLSLQFIPVLHEELQSIYGVDIKSGNILNRLRHLLPMLIIVFRNSFEKADKLAFDLTSPNYPFSENATKLRMTIKDYLFLGLLGIILVVFGTHKIFI